jgi:hypothetical protein
MIVDDAVVTTDGRWLYGVEHEPWNDGAMFFAGLNPSTLDDPGSRASDMLNSVGKSYMAGYRITPVLVFWTGRDLHWEFLRLWTGFELPMLHMGKSYEDAMSAGYEISGQCIDSTLGFDSEFSGYFNYRPSSLTTTKHPPVYDSTGRIAVLNVQSEFSFLAVVAKTVHARGQYLLGNSLWVQGTPNYNFPLLFDIAGTEIDWQAKN